MAPGPLQSLFFQHSSCWAWRTFALTIWVPVFWETDHSPSSVVCALRSWTAMRLLSWGVTLTSHLPPHGSPSSPHLPEARKTAGMSRWPQAPFLQPSFKPGSCQQKQSLLGEWHPHFWGAIRLGRSPACCAPHIVAKWRPPCGHLARQMPLDAPPNTQAWAWVTLGGRIGRECLPDPVAGAAVASCLGPPGRWRLGSGQLREGFLGSPLTQGDSRERRGLI